MAIILEFKEKFKKFYNSYNTVFVPAMKFLVALVSFIMINVSIGYMDKLKNPLFAILLSVICAFLPSGFTLIALSLFMLLHLYAISAEFALLALCIVLLMYLLYFRFTPRSAYILILTAMLCWIKLPFVIPVAVGLCASVLSFIPVSFGVIIYYIIRTASDYEAAISNQSISESMQQISYLVESLLGNRQMLVLILASSVTLVVVYVIRRLKIDHCWDIAIVAGSIVELLILVVGQISLKSDFNVVMMILGVILGAGISYICSILFFALDYNRTEYVQYEDDEYYYYITAVPKRLMAKKEVSVKQFGNTGRIPIPKNVKEQKEVPSGDTVIMDRKALAKELDIDEDLLN